jgi:hypothetical protein
MEGVGDGEGAGEGGVGGLEERTGRRGGGGVGKHVTVVIFTLVS